jgi:hypothetical protein
MVPEVSNLTGALAGLEPQRFGDVAEARRSREAALS